MIERDIRDQSPTPHMVPHRKAALVATSYSESRIEAFGAVLAPDATPIPI